MSTDNPAAYPSVVDILAGSFNPYLGRVVPPNEVDRQVELGMSLRDHFAGLAMQQFMHGGGILYVKGPTSGHVAQAAYEMADAMLAERVTEREKNQ